MARAYISFRTLPTSTIDFLLQQLSLILIALVFNTNWRAYPIAFMIPIVALQQDERATIRTISLLYIQIIVYTILITCTFIAIWFDFSITKYTHYFFGFFSASSPWSAITSTSFLHVLFHSIKTPSIIAVFVLSIYPAFHEIFIQDTATRPVAGLQAAAAPVAIFLSLLTSLFALKLNFSAGGLWYLCPQVILVTIYYNCRFSINLAGAVAIFACAVFLVRLSPNTTGMRYYYNTLDASRLAASDYARLLQDLDVRYGVFSEEEHLFRRTARLPLIDMGDTVEVFANANYFGTQFTNTYLHYVDEISSHTPVVVFKGNCSTSNLRRLIDSGDYIFLLASPPPLNAGAIYVRKDNLSNVRTILKARGINRPQ